MIFVGARRVMAGIVNGERFVVGTLLAVGMVAVVCGLLALVAHTALSVSCQRSNQTRRGQQAQAQAVRDGAHARLRSAQNESAFQAQVDRQTAARLLRDADKINPHLLRCSGVFPTAR